MRFNRTKRALAALLAVLTLLSVFGLSGPLGLVREADAASTITESVVLNRIERLKKALNGKIFTTDQTNCGNNSCTKCNASNIMKQSWFKGCIDLIPSSFSVTHYYYSRSLKNGYTCCGFANFAGWYIFAQKSSDSIKFKKVSDGSFNKATMDKARPGDIIRMANQTDSGIPGHSAIVIKVKNDGVEVLDDNYVSKHKVAVHTISYSKYKYVTISRATNYDVSQEYYLDLNGMLDGSSADNIEGFGTADVYINGTLVENDCTDYYAKWPAGTRYEIKDIRAKSGKVYAGVYSGSISGTIQTSRINVVLSFNTAKTPTVYFNANGGSVNTSGKTVTVGSTYGTLPTPTRTGYAFDGWYTSASGGSKVTPSTTVSNSSNHTLYAHWNLVYYTVYFNANGGSVSPSSVSIGHGRTYGTLPMPSRTGYAFDGWYTSASGGSKVTSGSTVTYGHTLYAHWSAKLNGWQTANNQTYYYRDGIKVTGWQKIDGRRFYFNASGAMLKGWQQIGGKWYYFIVQGSVGQSGTMLTGWQHLSGGKTFYFNSSGAMQTGWQKIDGKWYYFLVQGKAGQSGTMLTGWQKLSNKWFYFNSSGVMQIGWQKIGGKWYYFLVQGKAGQSGTMLTGWQKLSNKWYYFNASGAMQTGWQKISNNWYYFNASGVMLTGRQKIDGKWYRFDTSGRLLP